METNLRLFADYFQIHLLDDESDGDLSDVWNEQTVSDGLGVTEEALAIGTAVNVYVAVSVHVLAAQPDDDSDDFDHVVEASLNLASGRLVVLGCTDYFPDAARFDMPAGWIRIRASRRNLAAAVHADIDSDNAPETTEQVRLQAWPTSYSQPQITKRWASPAA
ncbi:hypothetical protein [Streptomyces hiroshimensis]|uniref:Uncharacterized protein n=1 Tax=Streptomyces hiroshimensis TaxID=66424 RepID=A0ABQ2Z5V0_9ACTN|nr:hypothetical protein [Streptomyces hiroshimensis]GGY04498.1 hypothetical protein GCM10010324_58990 [Streptomyces hiroshimensis]